MISESGSHRHETDSISCPQAVERACSDCSEYAVVGEMLETPAGNMVCGRCARRRERMAGERAQLTMFGQDSMF